MSCCTGDRGPVEVIMVVHLRNPALEILLKKFFPIFLAS
jgi:hypothetical protein